MHILINAFCVFSNYNYLFKNFIISCRHFNVLSTYLLIRVQILYNNNKLHIVIHNNNKITWK